MSQECIFCKIAIGESPSFKIYEDDDYIAFLDIMPNTKGMTVVIPKKHFSSYAFEMPEEDYTRLMEVSRKIGLHLDGKLGTQRTAMVVEGMGVDHVHVKLYPMHGLEEEWNVSEAEERVFFEHYPSYITTKMGPKADFAELEGLAKTLKMEG